jgi:ketosteroid isomerase-like protein
LNSPREVVVGFFEDLNGGRDEQAFARLAPDATFEVVAPPPIGGVHDMKGLPDILREHFYSMFSGPLRIDIVATTAEGERVAIETRTHAPLIDGTTYQNRYHWLVLVRDGRIALMREYQNSAYLVETAARIARFKAAQRPDSAAP